MTGFFALDPLPADRAGWATLADLAADPSARITATAAALGTADRRVAASTDLLGIAARVLSPALALAVRRSATPLLTAERVWWRHDPPAPMRIAFDVDAFGALDDFPAVVVAMRPVVDGYRASVRLSPQIAWGNVASALNGAAAVLGAGHDLVRAALSRGELAGSALRLSPRFVRNSCCLLYSLDGHGYCGDCVIATTVSRDG